MRLPGLRRLQWRAALCLLALCAGCSYVYVAPPPPVDTWDQPHGYGPLCTDSYLWPYVDGGFAVYGAIGAAALISEAAAGKSGSFMDLLTAKSIEGPAILGSLAAAVAFALAGWDGKGKVEACLRYRGHPVPGAAAPPVLP